MSVGGAILEPKGLIVDASHTSEKSNINNANFVLCQNVDPARRFVQIYNAGGTRIKSLALQPFSSIIIKKEPSELIHGSTGVGGAGNAADPSILFTKLVFNHLKNIHVIDS
jgi:hypothetical protein